MPTPGPQRRWFHLSPDRFVTSLLLGVCLLWVSNRFQWVGFNHDKGWTVLIAVAAVGVAALVIALWWIASRIFRWRFQFGIRSLLAFCVACSITAGWLATEIRQARRQAETVEWLKYAGGLPYYDWEVDRDSSLPPKLERLGPGWLREMVGDDFLSAVDSIGPVDNTFSDADLAHLKGFNQLRRLDLMGAFRVTDAGLVYLEDLANLQSLNLRSTNATDVGLEHLERLTQLRSLDISLPQVTDAGLAHLEGLAQLRSLDLSWTQVTDAGLVHLKELTNLQTLSLSLTQVTDAGLEHLKGLARLRSLDVSARHVTDAGVKGLQNALPNCNIIHRRN